MQMFLWPGLQFGLPNALTVDAPSGAAGTYPANFARFTPHAAGAGISGDIVLVDDGVAPVNDGCQAYTVPAGSIALVDNTSTCNDYTQTANAQAAGAAAIVLAHNTDRGAAHPHGLDGSAAHDPGDHRAAGGRGRHQGRAARPRAACTATRRVPRCAMPTSARRRSSTSTGTASRFA